MSYSNSTYAEDVADNYLFIKNMQGDIVHICDEEGNKIVSYQYDAWGTVTSYSGSNTTAYKINPFRYRGYYYDVELRLYYLNSRYYDPETGRFISADGYVSTGAGLLGYNMFAYCNNNPISFVDNQGKFPWVPVIIVAVIAVVAIDHYLAKNHPEGVQAIPDNNNNNLDEDILYAKGSGVSIEEDEIVLADLYAGLYDGTAEYDNYKVSLTRFFTGNAKAAVDYSGIPGAEFSANASIYTMAGEYTFKIGNFDVTVSGALNVGTVGFAITFDIDSGKLKFGPPSAGIGGNFGVDIDKKQ